jgi:hypothetical protein
MNNADRWLKQLSDLAGAIDDALDEGSVVKARRALDRLQALLTFSPPHAKLVAALNLEDSDSLTHPPPGEAHSIARAWEATGL